MAFILENHEIFGLIRPSNDAHTLGITSVANLLEDAGYRVRIAPSQITNLIINIHKVDNFTLLNKWISDNKITRLGFSYRLHPADALESFARVYYQLENFKLFVRCGGKLKQLYFAGLPDACKLVTSRFGDEIVVFNGEDSQVETLLKIGVPSDRIPESISTNSFYDEVRLQFGRELVKKENYLVESIPDTPPYPEFGTQKDSLIKRLNVVNRPLLRSHAGPYQSDYEEAKKEFLSWTRSLALTGYLDILSIGSSQLSQSDFGTEWGDKPNGGGVPINSELDLFNIAQAAKPMLLRTYSFTRNVPAMVDVYEKTINNAWYALSFWWFNKIDGRGPNGVLHGLKEHFESLKLIAKINKPFEPNLSHHFAFRGSDDYTYIIAAYLAVKAAKQAGIKHIVLQTMLNTPKYTSGLNDLIKVRVLLKLARALEDKNFRVFLQPRAGLDYFSPDPEKAKAQLAAVTALMDDIEPGNIKSPEIIHVVSYTEAIRLATPDAINESLKITIHALKEYRKQKHYGVILNFADTKEMAEKENFIYSRVKEIVQILETNVKDLYSPAGFYKLLETGVFPLPWLWEGRDEFCAAVNQKTGLYDGGVHVLDENNLPVDPLERINKIFNP